MGMFDYRNYTSDESANLVALSHQLALYSQVDMIMGMPVGGWIESLFDILPEGLIQGSADPSADLPNCWQEISAETLGGGYIDPDGYFVVPSPITGYLIGGCQLKLLGEYDENGVMTSISISFAGTNSPVDLPDYFQLNTGEMAAQMAPLLELVADLAQDNGLASEDVIITGYSLGGGYTNVMARFADDLADGFFADSTYIGHASPTIYEDDGRVLNFGAENDIVHRATGSAEHFVEALIPTLPFLSGQDYDLVGSTDNVVFFNGAYASPLFPLGTFSLLNPMGWIAHIDGGINDAIERISNSHFYEFTEEDSIVIVSNLGADMRGNTWVEDKATLASDHTGLPSFMIGTVYADLFRDGDANDYIDLGAGNDTVELSTGYDAVFGGSGDDTLLLEGNSNDWSAYALNDGTLALVSNSDQGVKIIEDIEYVTFTGRRWNPFDSVDYSVEHNRLEDLHWSFFQWGDNDLNFGRATQGTAGNDSLSGSVVFGLEGNDTINGTWRGDLLVGGQGEDQLNGHNGNDELYGAEDNDVLNGGNGNNILNGGHGDDSFVFNVSATGTSHIQDFNQSANENDMIILQGRFDDFDDLIDHGYQSGSDVIINDNGLTLIIENTTLNDLTIDHFSF